MTPITSPRPVQVCQASYRAPASGHTTVVPIYEDAATVQFTPAALSACPNNLSLELPVRHGEPARPSLDRSMGPLLASSLMACGESFFQLNVRPEQLNTLLQNSWDTMAKTRATTSLSVRMVQEQDRTRGYLDLVRELSGGEALSIVDFAWVMQRRLAQQHYTVVVDNGEGIIATASLLLECKFSHSGGLAGHIEDVIVEKDSRGCGLGLALVGVLKDLSDKLGVYKVILDATEDNVHFYERAGFKPAEIMLSFKPGTARAAQLATNKTQYGTTQYVA